MARLATPSRYFDLAQLFGRDASTIGRLCRWVQQWVYDHWGPLLRWGSRRFTPAVLEGYAAALVEVKNAPMDNCVGFVDGKHVYLYIFSSA